MTPEVRNIIAPVAALTAGSLLLVYGASCSGTSKPEPAASPEAPEATEAPIAATTPGDVPVAERFTHALPEVEVPAPAPAKASGGGHGPTVADVLDSGCSTSVVNGLSEQIIAEGNCIEPGAYARMPELKNVSYGGAVFPYMLTPARDALRNAVERGKRYEMKINSMLRTVAQQYLLYDWYQRGRCGIKLAAAPGASNHQTGLAIDISAPGTWRQILSRAGFRWMGERDRWHFDFVGSDGRAQARKGLDVEAFQRLWNRNHPDEPIRADGGWGDDTEQALRRAPVGGFPVGAVCRYGDNDE